MKKGIGSGFPEEIKCPLGTDGKNNAISNYACYFTTVEGSSVLMDPQKEDQDGSVGRCKGYTAASPLGTISVV
jgi:hypothetical protein